MPSNRTARGGKTMTSSRCPEKRPPFSPPDLELLERRFPTTDDPSRHKTLVEKYSNSSTEVCERHFNEAKLISDNFENGLFDFENDPESYSIYRCYKGTLRAITEVLEKRKSPVDTATTTPDPIQVPETSEPATVEIKKPPMELLKDSKH